MMKQYNRVCARIDLDAIEYNVRGCIRTPREGVSMISVIKTDGVRPRRGADRPDAGAQGLYLGLCGSHPG